MKDEKETLKGKTVDMWKDKEVTEEQRNEWRSKRGGGIIRSGGECIGGGMSRSTSLLEESVVVSQMWNDVTELLVVSYHH